MLSQLRRYAPDSFVLALIATVVVASLLPCRGEAAKVFQGLTQAAIALLFFMHGVRLPREAMLAGFGHWRLHLTILALTFVAFPLVGLGMSRAAPGLLPAELWLGVLFVCALPSTVQSSIALTSIARGNVPAAVGAATASNLLGVLLTPLIGGLLISLHGQGASLGQVWKVVVQLLVPFAAGHLLRPWLEAWAERRRKLVTLTDRGSILLSVYTSFSAAVVQGVWSRLGVANLAILVAVLAVLLAIMLAAPVLLARRLGFGRAEEAAILFCGSQKSLASGVPMAGVLFAGGAVGMTILPLMIYHQMQLMAGAALARRYAARPGD